MANNKKKTCALLHQTKSVDGPWVPPKGIVSELTSRPCIYRIVLGDEGWHIVKLKLCAKASCAVWLSDVSSLEPWMAAGRKQRITSPVLCVSGSQNADYV